MYGYHIPIKGLKVCLCKVQYRLDDELEYHDPAEPSTTSCPFLPGQSVNVLDVPMQFSSGEDHFRKEPTSSTGSTVYTMDPQAKYVSPVPSVRRKAKVPFLETSEISVPSVTKPSPLLTVRSLHAMSSTAPNSESLLESAPAEPFPKYTSASLPAPEHIPVVAAFQRLRGTKSADRIELLGLRHRNQSLLKSKVRNVLTESLSGLGRSNGHTSGSGAKPVISNKSPLRHTVRTQSVEDGTRVGAHSANNIGLVISGMKAQVRSASGVFSPVEIFSTKGSGDNSGVSEHELPAVPDSPYYTPLEQLRENKSFFEENATDRWNSCLSAIAMDCPDPVSDDQCSIHPVFRHAPDLLDVRPLPTHRTSLELRNNSFLPSETSFLDDNSDYEACNQEKSIASSEDIHEIFSPYLAASTVQTDTMSPYRLSQSISPLRSDFGEALLDLRDEQNLETSLKNTHEGFEKFRLPPLFEEFSRSQQTSYRSSSGFEGYSLPEEEQSSVLTLRNLPSSRLDDPSRDLPFSRQGSKDLVRSWNDGSEHRINGSQHRNNMTALDELVEDLGYLGEMIV